MVDRKKLFVNEMVEMKVSVSRASLFVELSRSTYYYGSCRDPAKDEELCQLIKEIALKFSFYGYRRIYRQLRRDGLVVNHKRVYRLYCEMNLKRPKKKKKKQFIPCHRDLLPEAAGKVNDVWVTDFIEDSMSNGRKLRVLAVEDQFSRKIVGFRIASSIRGADVAAVLDRAMDFCGRPTAIRSDNGPEYISKAVNRYLNANRIAHQRIEPGKPIQNCYAESFMSRFRDECLNMHLFRNLNEAREVISEYIRWFNSERLHSGLDYKTPDELYEETVS